MSSAVTISTITTNNNPSTSSKSLFYMYTPTRSTTATVYWLNKSLLRAQRFNTFCILPAVTIHHHTNTLHHQMGFEPERSRSGAAWNILFSLMLFIKPPSHTRARAHTHFSLHFSFSYGIAFLILAPYLIPFLYISWARYGEEEMKRIVLDLTVSDGEEFCRSAPWIECHLMLS